MIAQMSQYPLLSDAAQTRLLRAAAAGDEQAKLRVFRHNQRLVLKPFFSWRRACPEHGWPDLLNAALEGLWKAIGMFDPSRGFRLSTYAGPWINNHMQRWMQEHRDGIRLPVHRHEELQRIRAKLPNFMEHSAEEVASRTGEQVAVVRRLMQWERNCRLTASLDAPLGSGPDAGTFLQNIRDPACGIDAQVEQLDNEARVTEMLSALGHRQRRVIELRFGLHGEAEHTLEQVGAVLGLSRERVRQLEKQALAELRPRAECLR